MLVLLVLPWNEITKLFTWFILGSFLTGLFMSIFFTVAILDWHRRGRGILYSFIIALFLSTLLFVGYCVIRYVVLIG